MSNPAGGRGGGSQGGKEMPEWLREARNAQAAADSAASAAHREPERRYVRNAPNVTPSDEEEYLPAEPDGWPHLPKKPPRRRRSGMWGYGLAAGLAAMIAALLVIDWGSLANLGTQSGAKVERVVAQQPAPAPAAPPQERIIASSKPEPPPLPSQMATQRDAARPTDSAQDNVASTALRGSTDDTPRRVRTQAFPSSRMPAPEQQVAALPSATVMPAVPLDNFGTAPVNAPVAPAAVAPSGAQAARSVSPEEITILLRRGEEYLSNGDFAAARLMFQRAADTGHARGALMLGGTYDPLVLQRLGAYAYAVDIAKARAWYEKAREFGSPEAPRRLESLARAAQ